MSSAICINLDQSKILSSGNGLISHDKSESVDQRPTMNSEVCEPIHRLLELICISNSILLE